MWKAYHCDCMKRVDGLKTIRCRATFFQALKLATREERRRKTCTDYAIGALLYNNVTTLHCLLAAHINDVLERKRLSHLVHSAQEYEKLFYAAHISKYTDPTHNLEFALYAPPPHKEVNCHVVRTKTSPPLFRYWRWFVYSSPPQVSSSKLSW